MSAAIAGSGPFVRSAHSIIEAVDPGIRRQILGHGEELMVCRVLFEKDSVGTVHSHRHSQSTYVESGRFQVRIGDDEQTLGSGDSFYVEPDVLHGSVCLEAGVLIDTFSPAREDFLSSTGE